jgi:hypothetical protein
MLRIVRPAMPWPLPALLAWLGAWAVFLPLKGSGAAAFAAALATGAALALLAEGRWRRLIAGAGFPLSALVLGAAAALPPWAWLAAALPLLLAYPLKAWRDAPFFPTPADALYGLPDAIALPPQARVLDAGCGIGHGLAALARAWPQARLHGIEWSRPLAWAARRRCRGARIERGDMWAASWAGYDLVYLFQRPESMARALAKAEAEMPGGWLVSLEFEIPGARCLRKTGRKPVWFLRISGSTGRQRRR